jgi:RimJ/RimL family protein N-acetyltransferase
VAIFTDKPILLGERVMLRPVTACDATDFERILRDSEVARLTGSINRTDEVLTLENLREWYGSRGEKDDRLDLAVVDRATDLLVGEVVLNEWDRGSSSVNFRTLIGPAGRDRGLGTDATRLLLEYAFEHAQLHRVSLEVFEFNPRARHVYEKVGFIHEGTRREALRFEDQWVNAHDMAILDREWRQHRGRPQTL